MRTADIERWRKYYNKNREAINERARLRAAKKREKEGRRKHEKSPHRTDPLMRANTKAREARSRQVAEAERSKRTFLLRQIAQIEWRA